MVLPWNGIYARLSCFFDFSLTPFVLQVYSRVCALSVWPNRLFSSIWGVLVVFIEFIGPVIILVYCYGRIAWTLTRRIDSKLGTSDTTPEIENKLSSKFLQARNNTIKTVLLVGICFIICWGNDEIYYLMHNLGYNADWNSPYFKFCVAMIYLNCTVNPFVYLFSYQDYHKALREFCFKSTPGRSDVESFSSNLTFTTNTSK